MKRTYTKPALVKYGQLEELTLGTNGDMPDFVFPGFNYTGTCASTDTTTFACINTIS